jgi:ABC-type glycerol-3-phosphate transport system permease component
MTENVTSGPEPSHNEDHLDQLLRGFKSRNQFRSDPNYVLEPMDLTTSIPDRFVKILRSTSVEDFDEEFSSTQDEPTEPETNSGLIRLAENYDKNLRKKLARSRIFSTLAAVVLFVSVISFAALSGYVLAGIFVAVVAGVLIVLGRSSAKQAEEIHQIAEALVQPEETS